MITVTINIERQDLIDMGLAGDGEDVACSVNPTAIACFYPSIDEGKSHKGTKIHLLSGEDIWCYEDYKQVKAKVESYLSK